MATSGLHTIGMLFFLVCSFCIFFSLLATLILTAKLAGYGHLNQALHFCIPWFAWPSEAKECARIKEARLFRSTQYLIFAVVATFVLGAVFVQF